MEERLSNYREQVNKDYERFKKLVKKCAPCGECGTELDAGLMYEVRGEVWYICANDQCGVALPAQGK